jgi:hypothetical protein
VSPSRVVFFLAVLATAVLAIKSSLLRQNDRRQESGPASASDLAPGHPGFVSSARRLVRTPAVPPSMPHHVDDVVGVLANRAALEADSNPVPTGRAGSVAHSTTDAGGSVTPSASDRRFVVRWGEAGFCPREDSRALLVKRMRLLSQFRETSIGYTQFRHSPVVARGTLEQIASALVDWSPAASTPSVIVYRDIEEMRSIACINQAAIGYYDGSIHLSAEPGRSPQHVRETVIHEFMHHVLLSLGVRQPMWFHEGLAMFAADERWFTNPRLGLVSWLKREHLPFDLLTVAFPHTADETFATAAYYQSFMMLQFVRSRRGGHVFRALASVLASGELSPGEAFASASGLPPTEIETAWRAFVEQPSITGRSTP